MRKVDPKELQVRPFHLLDEEWALLVSGKGKPNPMTVSWGGFGTLWHKPAVTIYVRPTRHTYALLNESDEFTLNFLPERFRSAMDFCGSRSGRDTDKWKETGFHMEKSETIAVPRIREARLAFECRVMAYQDFDPGKFVADDVEGNYPKKDYHRIYWGEPTCIWEE
jgi:flavin reductase (DIM6/NTAB) family NADH-FMN oxidoreductase RutF